MKSDLNRRKFLKQLFTGTAGTIVFSTMPGIQNRGLSKGSDKKLGVAVAGLGSYATHQLTPAFQQTRQCELRGIVTGTPAKAEIWSKKHNIPAKNIYNYQNMNEIADNDDIDIVYITLPNAMHAEYSIKAAEAGKHVICEKPFTTTVEDAQRVVDVFNKNKRKLSIGYRLHFDPFNKEMMRLGQNEIYGKVKKIKAGFGFELNNPYRWRLRKFMAGGGSLMDVGIYAVQGAVYIMGELPKWIEANIIPDDDPMFNEVENRINWTLHFSNGAVAECESSYSASPDINYLDAEAEEGKFGIEPAYSYGGISGYTPDGTMNLQNVNQQAHQMDDFARRIKNNTESPVPGEMGYRDMYLLQSIYDAAETGQAIKVDAPNTILDLVKS